MAQVKIHPNVYNKNWFKKAYTEFSRQASTAKNRSKQPGAQAFRPVLRNRIKSIFNL